MMNMYATYGAPEAFVEFHSFLNQYDKLSYIFNLFRLEGLSKIFAKYERFFFL